MSKGRTIVVAELKKLGKELNELKRALNNIRKEQPKNAYLLLKSPVRHYREAKNKTLVPDGYVVSKKIIVFKDLDLHRDAEFKKLQQMARSLPHIAIIEGADIGGCRIIHLRAIYKTPRAA